MPDLLGNAQHRPSKRSPNARTRKRPRLLANARKTAADLGERMGQVRRLRGLTMPQVERLTDWGIERSALSRIEAGTRKNPSLATLLMLCVAYDMDILLRRDGRIEIRGTDLQRLAHEEIVRTRKEPQ